MRLEEQILMALAALLAVANGKNERSSELELLTSTPTHCTYERAYEMYGVHCGGLKLSSIPNHLKPGIEILDLTDNKIRELQDNSFSSYTSIKYLYLADNSIFLIEPESFSPLSYMQTLDLSKNALTSIPSALLNMPSLRKLYLSGNALVNWVDIPKPIKAPLEHLDISDCRIQELPDFGTMPQLRTYNASVNPLRSLQALNFARTCNLATLDLSGSMYLIPLCEIKPAITWVSMMHVNIILSDYTRLNSNDFYTCPEILEPLLNSTFATCQADNLTIRMNTTTRKTWLTITGGLAGFLVAFMLLLYLMHRRNVAQTKTVDKKTNKYVIKDDNDNRAKATLINNAS